AKLACWLRAAASLAARTAASGSRPLAACVSQSRARLRASASGTCCVLPKLRRVGAPLVPGQRREAEEAPWPLGAHPQPEAGDKVIPKIMVASAYWRRWWVGDELNGEGFAL